MLRVFVRRSSQILTLLGLLVIMSVVALSQSDVREVTVVVNGHSGTILIYRINEQTFVDIDALARIGTGSTQFTDNQLILTIPAASTRVSPSASQVPEEMTKQFMTAA